MMQLNLPGLGVSYGLSGNDWPAGTLSGATYDPVTRRLFAMGRAITGNVFMGRMYVYQVNA
jgi:hypothetical protein